MAFIWCVNNNNTGWTLVNSETFHEKGNHLFINADKDDKGLKSYSLGPLIHFVPWFTIFTFQSINHQSLPPFLCD